MASWPSDLLPPELWRQVFCRLAEAREGDDAGTFCVILSHVHGEFYELFESWLLRSSEGIDFLLSLTGMSRLLAVYLLHRIEAVYKSTGRVLVGARWTPHVAVRWGIVSDVSLEERESHMQLPWRWRWTLETSVGYEFSASSRTMFRDEETRECGLVRHVVNRLFDWEDGYVFVEFRVDSRESNVVRGGWKSLVGVNVPVSLTENFFLCYYGRSEWDRVASSLGMKMGRGDGVQSESG